MEAIATIKATISTVNLLPKRFKKGATKYYVSPPRINPCKSPPFQFEIETEPFSKKLAISPHPIRYTGNSKNKNARDHLAGVFISWTIS
jgi:hypothetical protein